MVMIMLKSFFSTLFIDIRGSTVHVVQGRHMDSRLNFNVDGYGSLVLPGNFSAEVNNNVIYESAQCLKDFLSQKNMKAKRVIAGLGYAGVICRNARVPMLKDKDLENMMKLNINDYLPVIPNEYAFDYKVLDDIEEDGKRYLELMVAAVKHRQAEQFALLLEKAGLKPVAFDILPNMLYRLFEHIPFQDTMVVDGGRDGCHLVIFKGKSLFMYTDIPFKVNNSTENDYPALAGEMRGYMDYYSSRNFGRTVDNICLLGELAVQPGVKEIVAQQFSVPVSVGLNQDGILKFKGKAGDFADHAALYAGIIGLMMRGSRTYSGPGLISKAEQADHRMSLTV